MKETVIARTALAPPIVLAAALYAIFAVALAGIPGIFKWIFLGALTWGLVSFVRRIVAMRLAVNDETVIVVNFGGTHALDLETVTVDSRVDREAWPQDDLIDEFREALGRKPGPSKSQTDMARGLWLCDSTGEEVRVGVAPAYGSRLDLLAEELIVAIEERRTAA